MMMMICNMYNTIDEKNKAPLTRYTTIRSAISFAAGGTDRFIHQEGNRSQQQKSIFNLVVIFTLYPSRVQYHWIKEICFITRLKTEFAF